MADLDQKVTTNGKLTMQEVQYMDLLAHAEKSLLTCEAMKEHERKDAPDPMLTELHSLIEKAPNDQIKRRYSEFVSEIQSLM